MNPTEKRLENQYILFDRSLDDAFTGADFDIDTYQQQGRVVGQASGRGLAYFVKRKDVECVLRHFRRGGMMAKLSQDKYWWTGPYGTRAFREWYLLSKLKDWELPVPRVIAARVIRHGLWYTADLLTERIINSASLSGLLIYQKLQDNDWRKIGTVLRRFHQRGVYHADLNAHNILWTDSGEVYLVDFDKGRLRSMRRSWQLANLQRLQRSFMKILHQTPNFNFDEQDWKHLIAGYTQL